MLLFAKQTYWNSKLWQRPSEIASITDVCSQADGVEREKGRACSNVYANI